MDIQKFYHLGAKLFLVLFVIASVGVSIDSDQRLSIHQSGMHYKRVHVRHLSSPETEDTLTLVAQGPDLYRSSIRLTIHGSDGNELYRDSFLVCGLLGLDSTLAATGSNTLYPTRVEDSLMVLSFLDRYFDDEGFEQFPPASGEESDAYDAWKESGGDYAPIVFYYVVGQEETLGIAYSKSKHRFVVFYSCC